MKLSRYTITPKTAFGSPLVGDSLFGHLCWAIRNSAGESKLTELLDGYLDGNPFAVVSDAVPAGYLPRPTVPVHLFSKEENPSRRKEIKRKRWVQIEVLGKPFESWLASADGGAKVEAYIQPHNSIDRMTGTTGTGQFAPYSVEQLWHSEGAAYDLYVCHDEARLKADDLSELLASMGASGFGRDASVGLGKFDVSMNEEQELPKAGNANAYLTLACCAPQGQGFQSGSSFYEITNRFGRHGDIAALTGIPYKNPILMAGRGAVFTPSVYSEKLYIGQGIGGNGTLSVTLPDTVHQGYAPVVSINIPPGTGGS